MALSDLRGLIVIAEVQRATGIFDVLRVLADRTDDATRYLLLGSASTVLIKGVSESLAGRIFFFELGGFELTEVVPSLWRRLWIRGGFPRAFLADDDLDSFKWRQDFARTFVERDLPQLGINLPTQTVYRFWTMLAHSHGQVANLSAFGRALGVADTTVRRYLDVMAGSYMVRVLTPWHENLKKRQVKSPKVYIRDSGLLHSLLGQPERADVESHAILGASWEGFAMDQVIRLMRFPDRECHFWATHADAELDLLHIRGRKRTGFEFKWTDAPKVTRSMKIAINDLGLESIYVVHAGEHSFAMAENIQAISIKDLRNTEPLAPLAPCP